MAYCTYLFEHFEHYNIYYCISDRFKLCQWPDQREWRISMTQITFSNIIYLQVSTWTSEDGITQKEASFTRIEIFAVDMNKFYTFTTWSWVRTKYLTRMRHCLVLTLIIIVSSMLSNNSSRVVTRAWTYLSNFSSLVKQKTGNLTPVTI